jgi:TatA/E family protein of Tat protein translocase
MLALINDTGMVVLAALVLVLFGTSQIPKLARNLAEAGKEFRKAQAEMEAERPTQAHLAERPTQAHLAERPTQAHLAERPTQAHLAADGPTSNNV